jgi:hypothetical protein
MNSVTRLMVLVFIGVTVLLNCNEDDNPVATHPDVDRLNKISGDITKRVPETDQHPPILHSDEFQAPVPLPGDINTAGGEDSPYILPEGNTMYFFFTPDVRVPPEKQLLDEVTGVWGSQKQGDSWGSVERVWLQEPGKLALDGALCVQGNEMWFASAREGYTGVNNFIAEWMDGKWANWRYVGDRLMKELRVGETHLHSDDLYYHSDLTGGKGDFDIWKTTRTGGTWSDPVNIEAVNTPALDGFPFMSSDGKELWFTRQHNGTPAIFRSIKSGDTWTAPEMIVSQFAGEPTLDDAGNLYFVHHFFENDVMIEADIYVAFIK